MQVGTLLDQHYSNLQKNINNTKGLKARKSGKMVEENQLNRYGRELRILQSVDDAVESVMISSY